MSDSIKIVTNNKTRPILYWEQLSKKEQGEFNFDMKEDAEYIRYRKQVYTLCDFTKCPPNIIGFDCALVDSFFSAIVVKFVGDGVVCALALS